MMKLLPGMTFLCISDLVVEGNRCFKSGNIYRCTSVGSFTNDLGVRHYWGSYYDGELEENTFFRYFTEKPYCFIIRIMSFFNLLV